MAGIWSQSPPPVRPGLYINFETVGAEAVPAGNNGIVGLPFTADWGPVGEFTDITSDTVYRNIYGPNNYGTSWLVQDALRGGALRVLGYRIYDGDPEDGKSDIELETDNASLTVSTLQDGSGAQNEEQEIAYAVTASGGSFTISFTGTAASPIAAQTTAAIGYDASAAAVQAALEDLAGIAPGDVNVTGGSLTGAPIVVEFTGTYALTDMEDLTVNGANLTGGEVVVNFVAKYAGTRGDNLRIVVRENPLSASKTDVLIFETNELREKYVYDDTDHADLVAQINDASNGSAFVVASLDTGHSEYGGLYTTEIKKDPTGTYMSGGDNGDGGITVSTYIDPLGVLDMFERHGGFDVFTLDAVSDTSIIDGLKDWVVDMNEKGNYVMAVIGGDSSDTLSSAVSRSETIDIEHIVNVGVTRLNVTDASGTTVERSTCEMTARVAGAIAGAGINRAITFVDLSAPDSVVELANPMTKDEIEEAINAGVVVFTKRGARTVIEDGVTSFTSFTTERDRTFGNIKSVRTMHQIGRDFNELVEGGFIGQTNNNAATRSALISAVLGYLQNLEAQGALVNGSRVLLDDRFNNEGENVYLLLLVQFGRELKRVLMTLRAPLLS